MYKCTIRFVSDGVASRKSALNTKARSESAGSRVAGMNEKKTNNKADVVPRLGIKALDKFTARHMTLCWLSNTKKLSRPSECERESRRNFKHRLKVLDPHVGRNFLPLLERLFLLGD
jgi:hypothetical protein